jgi:hypothetical protein
MITNLKKSSAIDSETHEPVYYCYISNDPIPGEYRRLIVFIVSSLIPVIAMTVFGIALVYQIQKMIAFRRQTVAETEQVQDKMVYTV